MSNISQETLASLLTGKLAFKVFNSETDTWELVNINSPDLAIHAGAKASVYQAGHVQLSSDLTSESEVLAPTMKALNTVFKSVSVHVNEESTHLTPEQVQAIDLIAGMQTELQALRERVTQLEGNTEPTV